MDLPRVLPLDLVLDQTLPFFVHPSDGPSFVTFTQKLIDLNYLSMARSMKRAL